MISERCDLFFIFFKIHSISNKEVSIERGLNMLEEWLFGGLFVMIKAWSKLFQCLKLNLRAEEEHFEPG